MPAELLSSNVVIAARQLNPSIFSQIWLVRNEILAEEDFEPGSVYSDMAVNVQSREFSLVVLPHQLQFAPKVPVEQESRLVAEKVGTVVRELPHTPYDAVGLNFIWHVLPEGEDIRELSRRLFYVPGSPFFQAFDTSDARYGAYVSKDVLDCRLKLDVKTTMRNTDQEDSELLRFAFNFHLDVAGLERDEVVGAIEKQLQRWEPAKQEAGRIVMSAMEGE